MANNVIQHSLVY